MLTINEAKQRAFDRCNLQNCFGGDIDIYKEMYKFKALRELPDNEFDAVYDELAERLGFYR